jgi:hypothetical protein
MGGEKRGRSCKIPITTTTKEETKFASILPYLIHNEELPERIHTIVAKYVIA